MMKQQDLLKKTGAILNELQEQYQFLAADPEQLSELELELFLANANFLTEHVQILRKISNFHPIKALAQNAEPPAHDEIQSSPTRVFDDFFTPDKETPTFEFIVNDRPNAPHFVAESASQVIEPEGPGEPVEYPAVEEPEEDPYEEPYEPYKEPEEEEPVEEPLEAPVSAASTIHPVFSNMDISSIPPEQISYDEEAPIELNQMETVEEEDELGPEPFLVSREPEPVAEPTPAPAPIVAAVPEPVIPIFTAPKEEPKQETSYETFTPKYEEPVPPSYAATTESQQHKPTLNELLAASRAGASKSQEPEAAKPAITDLKRAINLNEKLLFVKDLFDGYNLAYSEAIDLLNKMPDFNTADQFLKKHYATKHNWASKQSTADQFYDLLHQRFPK
jgi:hypothetical protein